MWLPGPRDPETVCNDVNSVIVKSIQGIYYQDWEKLYEFADLCQIKNLQ